MRSVRNRTRGWVVRKSDGRAVPIEQCLFVGSGDDVKAFKKNDAMMMGSEDHVFVPSDYDGPSPEMSDHPAARALMAMLAKERGLPLRAVMNPRGDYSL